MCFVSSIHTNHGVVYHMHPHRWFAYSFLRTERIHHGMAILSMQYCHESSEETTDPSSLTGGNSCYCSVPRAEKGVSPLSQSTSEWQLPRYFRHNTFKDIYVPPWVPAKFSKNSVTPSI